MTRKFDVVIGNPPYQEEAQGSGTRDTPVYHKFMTAAYELGSKAVLITPARFLFNAGFTPREWNERMLADPHLKVPIYSPTSSEIFPGTDIMGGIAVTYYDADRYGEPIGTFTKYPELNAILQKVVMLNDGSILDIGITSSRSYRYTERLYADFPEARILRPEGNVALINTNAFEQFHFLYHLERPEDGHNYVQVLGLIKNRRINRWIRRDYIAGPENFLTYKVVVPASNGSENVVIGSPVLGAPSVAVTQTFITIGSFEAESEAAACLNYVKTQFARALLGVLKITQHNPARVWRYVPLQDFTAASDIDWTKPIPEIDRQLYAKYELDDDEIRFIETHVKPMT